ncbi:MAG: Ig-like domain-containing protein [Anaerolineaceae bacterium]|jgi:hypothetical protein|nr:Ig-like domain-containing protein [Anaerolineaceae bacterium]
MNNKRLMKVLGLLLAIGLMAVFSPLTRVQARTTDMFSIIDRNIDGLVVDDSGRQVISPQSGTPVIDSIPAQTTNELVELSFVVHAEPGFTLWGTDLQYSLIGAPSGATLTKTNNTHATFRWTPTEAQGPGTYNFTVRVCETAGIGQGCATRPVSVTVNEVNVAPVLAPIGNQEGNELEALTFTATATDADIPVLPLVFSLADGAEGDIPEGAAITPAGAFSWTPTEAQGPGVYTFDVCVSDGALNDCETITVTVNEVNNHAPVLGEITYDPEVDEKVEMTFDVSASDADEPHTLNFYLDGAPDGAGITADPLVPDTAEFSWTPSEAQGPGEYTFDVCVTDGNSAWDDCQTLIITVLETNSAPELEEIAYDDEVDEMVLMTFTAVATDSDPGDILTYSLVGAPAGAAIDPSTGVFTWTPSEAQGLGDYTFTVKVCDIAGLCDQSDELPVRVNEVNLDPVLALIGDQEGNELEELTFTATATDADLPIQALTYSLAGAPAGAAIDPESGEFSWTPTEAQGPSEYTFDVCVTDSYSGQDCETITVVVNEVNVGPVIEPIDDQTIPEEVPWSYTVVADDDDDPAQTLTYSLEDGEEGEVPEGAEIDPESGELTWTPSEAQGPGEYMFDVVVNDGVDVTYLTINIEVEEVNVAPVLDEIGPQTVDELDTLEFTATATDHDIPAQELEFSLVGAPEGASIDPATGKFSWTPSEEEGPGTYTFDVCVSDGALSDCETITVTVGEVNVAPVLDPIGNQEGNELEALTFTATATDVDDPEQTLVFSLADGEYGDVPEDAEITPAGAFSWTPSEAQGPGDYIFDVCVSDGALSDCETITVVVNEVNVAPDLDPLDYESEVNELELMSFTASASDADVPAQALVFSLENGVGGLVPEGASIETLFDEEEGKYYGEFSWTPSEVQGPGEYTFDVCVSDGALSDCETVVVTVLDINSAPILDLIGNQTIDELQELAFTATASDSDIPAQSLSFSIDAEAPDGASIDPVTGEFSWIPTEVEGPGEYHVYVYVTDGVLMDYERITITVNEVNVPPVLDPIGPQEVDEGTELTFTASASDEDKPDQDLEFSLEDFPEGASIDPDTGVFSWEPTEEQGPGVYFIVVCVTDGVDSTCETIPVTVNEVNEAPVLDPIGNMDADELVELTFTATASDVDAPAQTLTFSLVDAPEGASIDPATGEFSWTPNELQGGSAFTFRVVVSDGELSDYEIITVYVNETNSEPVLDPIGPQTVDEEVEISFTATASDSDVPEQTLTFSLVGAPEGASIDPATGEFSWTPTEAEDGIYTFDVCVSDGELDDCETITVTVNEVNVPPVLGEIADQTVDEHETLEFTATASDGDDPEQELVFSLDGAPTGAVIDPETGEFSWTPTEAQGPGIYTFSVLVSDGIEYDYQFVTVTVNEVNVAPVLEPIGNKIGYPEFELTFTAHATDADIPVNPLTFSLDGAPEGAVIDPSSGVFSWTPSETGEYTFTVLVNDGLLYDFEIITVTVEGNNPPVLDPIGDKTANELVSLTFTASASDPDEGQILTFSLVDAPEGAVINSLSGVFSWTPSEEQGPGEYTFDVCVSDSILSDCETITVAVSEVNVAPVLAEIGDKSVAELVLLSFTATATDADIPAQTLEFSLADGAEGDVPEGAVITAAGAFSWTPSEAQGPGEYTFDVCVSDGTLSDCETITVTVSEVNVAPVAVDDEYTVAEKETLTITAPGVLGNDSDVDGDPLTAILVDTVSNGSLTLNADGSFTYEPDEYFNGTDSFTYKAKDAVLESDLAVVTITVTPVNDWPIANDDFYETVTGVMLDVAAPGVLDNDVLLDPDEEVSIQILEGPQHGSLSMNDDGSFTYTPDTGFMGTDTFRYQVNSVQINAEWSDDAMVTILVKPYMSLFLPIILR